MGTRGMGNLGLKTHGQGWVDRSRRFSTAVLEAMAQPCGSSRALARKQGPLDPSLQRRQTTAMDPLLQQAIG